MNRSINNRKRQHIDVMLADSDVDRRKNYFDQILLAHRGLPEIDLDAVDTSIRFLGKQLSAPLLISSMTGGDDPLVRVINKNLALAAQATQVAMAVGSQRVMFIHPQARASFDLRRFAPSTLLFANLGAVQLNYGFGLQQCRTAVEVLQADALYLHLNPLQEAVQPEGNVNFAGLIRKIADLNHRLQQPVILKEVGAGLCLQDVRLALRHGLSYFDVAGSGGTSWSRIEHRRDRRKNSYNLGLTFQDWGIPTPLALQQLRPLRKRITLIGSGGVRSGIDVIKCMVLGASLVGLAFPFFKPAMKSPDAVIAVIRRLQREIKIGMFLLGITKADRLIHNDRLLLYAPTVEPTAPLNRR
ncbi:type 2 isopentenyl-diphosphate Delta-isomerase [bacterium]|nr:type 2 isopentenyl-diphosphate Delta-isomerase [bacterium]